MRETGRVPILSALVLAVVVGLSTPVRAAEGPPEIVTVGEREVPEAVTAFGVVHADAEAVLSAKVLARVEALPLREGAPVRAGDLLVALDHRDIDAELAAADAARLRAQASLTEAEAEYKRVKKLSDTGSATPREMERAESALSDARGGLTEADARVEQVRTRKAYTRVTAPFDGRLVERRIEVGELAAPGTPLVRVESTAGFELWADVPQEEVGRIAPGGEATVRVDGIAEPIAGRVARLVPAADPRSHTFTVKIALGPPAGPALYSGMFGQVEIVHGTRSALVVPATAIVRRSEVAGVYLAGEGPADLAFRLVRPGRRVGDDQVVESGLNAGERVYADGPGAARARAGAAR